jgi:hypothetical protein
MINEIIQFSKSLVRFLKRQFIIASLEKAPISNKNTDRFCVTRNRRTLDRFDCKATRAGTRMAHRSDNSRRGGRTLGKKVHAQVLCGGKHWYHQPNPTLHRPGRVPFIIVKNIVQPTTSAQHCNTVLHNVREHRRQEPLPLIQYSVDFNVHGPIAVN